MSEQPDLPNVSVEDLNQTHEEQPLEQAPAPEQAEQNPFADKFAALARREKMLQQREQEWKKQKQEWEQQQEKYSSFENYKKQLEEDPLSWLESQGVDYATLTERALGVEKQYDPRAEIERLEAELKKRDELQEKWQQEQKLREQQAQADKVINDWRVQIDTIVKDQDKFPLINIKGAKDDVLDLIGQYFEQYQEVLPIEKAVDLVESQLKQEAEAYKDYFTKSQPTQPQESTKQAIQTLTNSLPVGNNPLPKQPDRHMSSEQSKKEAAKLLKWN